MSEYISQYTYSSVVSRLAARLGEPAPGRIQLLTGPRQVGKTTLLLELAGAQAPQAVYVAADGPEASMPGWWAAQWQKVEKLCRRGKTVMLIDEIQYLPQWSRLLKSETDRARRSKLPVHVVASGSSALELAAGSRESMAGRFERLRLLHWPAREIAGRFGVAPDEAAVLFVKNGSFPGAMSLLEDKPRWRAYVRDGIIEPAIGRDILMTQSIRKPALLRQLFAVCVGHPAEIVSLQKICGLLSERGAVETMSHYLRVLEDAYVAVGVEKYSKKAVRRRAAPPKLVVLNNGMLAAMAPDAAPEPESRPESWGKWVENACMAHAWNAGQQVYYWREEPLEVDFIVEGSWGKWAIEVKTGAYASGDLAGLLEFCRRYRGFRPLLLCEPGTEAVAARAGIEAISWQGFLLGCLPE